MADLIKPRVVQVKDLDGVEHEFTISRFPAVEGREIITQYPITATPKVGEYKLNEDLMLKALAYVEVKPAAGEPLRLNSKTLINNHTHDYECLMRLEWELMGYNSSFFGAGKTSPFFAGFAETMKEWISSTLTVLLAQSSRATKQP